MYQKVIGLYFSGTGTTKKMVNFLTKQLATTLQISYETFDFTSVENRKIQHFFSPWDIVVLGTPVIAGRVPNLLLDYLYTLVGQGALGIPIVLFGNRNFDSALLELKEIMLQKGFFTIAAGAFSAEHSFSTYLGKGRPDLEDWNEARNFVQKIAKKICSKEHTPVVLGNPKEILPYYKPVDSYGNPIDIRKVKPKTDKTLCIQCGTCAQNCPLGSISKEDISLVLGICMKCCKCIKFCPVGAKYFDDPGYLYHKKELETLYGNKRAQNQCFV